MEGVLHTSDALAVVLHLEAAHAHFVTADDGLEVVFLAEPIGDVGTELQPDTALAGATAGVLLGIGPQHLHHQPFLAWLPLLVAVVVADVLQGDLVVREESSVKDQELAADQGRQREGAEGLGEELEGALVVLGLALALKPVDPVHVVRLVVPSVEEEAVGVQPLVGKEQQRDFCRPRAPVDEIAVEEIHVGFRWEAVPTEDFQEVEILPCTPGISEAATRGKSKRGATIPCVSPQTVIFWSCRTETSGMVGSVIKISFALRTIW